MKVNVRILVALAMFTLTLSGAALAASSYDQTVRANIPFNFYADGKLQPAGNYSFAINLSSHSIEMSSGYKDSGRFLVGAPADGTSKSVGVLTFRTDGAGVYVLQKAQWTDYGVNFNIKGELARAADVRPLNATQTVIAQLSRYRGGRVVSTSLPYNEKRGSVRSRALPRSRNQLSVIRPARVV